VDKSELATVPKIEPWAKAEDDPRRNIIINRHNSFSLKIFLSEYTFVPPKISEIVLFNI